MNNDKYSKHPLFLNFRDESVEADYRDFVLERTLLFSRIAWVIVIFLGGSFGLLDRGIFGDNSGLVLMVRAALLFAVLMILAGTYYPRLKRYMDWNSFLFITLIGLFCIFLIAVSDTTRFTPYFTGLFFAYTGVFSVAGLGFRQSFWALLINLALFELVFGLLTPVTPLLFLVYNFFLLGMVVIFIYIAYLVERISRENFVVSARLKDSLAEVRSLSGLLPICSHCKKIRDDKGYWQQVETYIEAHSEAEFSHGLCPSCGDDLYQDHEWYDKVKKEREDGE